MLINKPTLFLSTTINDLQEALDSRDIESINNLMSKIYPDYDAEHAETLIAFNLYADIHAYDLVNFHCLNPQAKFISLFLYDDDLIKFMCNHNMREYFMETVGEG